MMTVLIVSIVSGALIIGALWGIYGRLPEHLEGFLVALAGGALLVSALLELIDPALQEASIPIALTMVFVGAITFTVLDYLVKKKWGGNGGGGLLAAITLDGIPENLALGVALIGAEPLAVAALSGSILLSNLPEAAGGAKEMVHDNHSKKKVLLLWCATAVLLSAAALVGNFLLTDVSEEYLNYIKCFAGGAVVASLALEVFPQSFQKDKYWTGLAVTIGLVLALYLNTLGN
ncbi:MAG TPA: zinc transporter [Cryomorphaceae bacterium]|nr:zinc transporter [Owenweeksia sp.]MBF97799.1 zinc transporter [Owenweeksia sp.]HAD96625.1 zinc transporter [Cryomorphaceae bacterium]HBF19046.1 zinc transporter [Cryomorphaceae bacterium]HCQ15032.1 zinc transporter [Cryomorphaceae bacterium]|tara:strand:+ start:350 stop:1048 length:699 start_codon:yes stop_codon:yes gene_type:complete